MTFWEAARLLFAVVAIVLLCAAIALAPYFMARDDERVRFLDWDDIDWDWEDAP